MMLLAASKNWIFYECFLSKLFAISIAVLILLFVQLSFASAEVEHKAGETGMKIVSPAFENGQVIPKKYTGDGANLSPPLKWSNVPKNTKSLALVVDDPDAPMGTWVHWLIYGIPAVSSGLEESTSAKADLPDGSKQGKNSWDKIGYGGPAPPPGKVHRYFFKLFALDQPVTLRPGARKEELMAAVKEHILASAELVGTYAH